MLPKSYEYMIKLGFVILKGYNIVGGAFHIFLFISKISLIKNK
jgi:hypothetical protein